MSVYKAINAIQAELAKIGISKDSKNTFDGYNFRGIDAVYNALSPLLAKHGLCILPRVLSRVCDERVSKKGDPMFYVTVEAEFDFVCAGDGSKHTVKTYGEAMDRSDKATNKAMSAAYKYAAFQAFAIPTEGDNDADAHTPTVAAKGPAPTASKPVAVDAFEQLSPEEQQFLREQHAIVMESDNPTAMYKTITDTFDADEKVAFWSLFDSKQRAAIKAGAK